ncbi:hypothetical protein EYF80_012038 [Liparis tanakae]|uniref:Uncharacterized protein n=1 Tax=Liparis tanakae TaxID=230148 RepID=A0A4Z2IIC8_9TELE|nr:hypothetical protein EYF80_012038 [Liparis tanakae]
MREQLVEQGNRKDARAPRGHVMLEARGHVMLEARGHVMLEARGHVMLEARGHVMLLTRRSCDAAHRELEAGPWWLYGEMW